jgi:tRNA threonylcarbamoyladenosine biosynthesis protein TsaE
VSTGHGANDSGSYTLPDEAATLRLGAALARVLEPGLSVWLGGDLGAGKTTFTRGLLRELGYTGRVKSPTFTLVETYALPRFTLCHFDLYRFHAAEEWDDAGFRDYFNADTVCLVEWPQRAEGFLPTPDIRLQLEFEGEGRLARLDGLTKKGHACCARLSY